MKLSAMNWGAKCGGATRSLPPIRLRRTTENAIGRGGKIRAKRMRGFKRADTILPIMVLLSSLSGVLAGVPFQSLLT